jgi:hypothetical protein
MNFLITWSWYESESLTRHSKLMGTAQPCPYVMYQTTNETNPTQLKVQEKSSFPFARFQINKRKAITV